MSDDRPATPVSVPPDWDETCLGECIDSISAGTSVNSEDRPHGSGEIGVLKTSAVSSGQFHATENKAVDPAERGRVSEPVLKGSILVSRMNTPNLVGESCFVPEDWPDLYLPDRLWQLKVNDSSQINMKWLSYLLQGWQSRTYVQKNATGTSGSMKNLAKSRLRAMPISLPPITEQRRIAEVLETLDDQIRTAAQIVSKLVFAKQGILEALLSRIDLSATLLSESIIGIDAGWSPDCIDSTPTEGEWGVLKVSAVSSGVYRPNESKKLPPSLTPRPGIEVRKRDVLCVRANGVGSLVGRVAYVESTPSRLMLSDKTLRLVPTRRTDPYFLSEILSSREVRLQMEVMMGGSSTQKNISQSQLKKLRVRIPDYSYQKLSAEVLRAANGSIHKEEDTLEKLRSLKQGLMEDLLTGRVRVPVEPSA